MVVGIHLLDKSQECEVIGVLDVPRHPVLKVHLHEATSIRISGRAGELATCIIFFQVNAAGMSVS